MGSQIIVWETLYSNLPKSTVPCTRRHCRGSQTLCSSDHSPHSGQTDPIWQCHRPSVTFCGLSLPKKEPSFFKALPDLTLDRSSLKLIYLRILKLFKKRFYSFQSQNELDWFFKKPCLWNTHCNSRNNSFLSVVIKGICSRST